MAASSQFLDETDIATKVVKKHWMSFNAESEHVKEVVFDMDMLTEWYTKVHCLITFII